MDINDQSYAGANEEEVGILRMNPILKTSWSKGS